MRRARSKEHITGTGEGRADARFFHNVEKAFEQLECMSPIERRRYIGEHVTEGMMHSLIEGRPHQLTPDTHRHLVWCDTCSAEVLRMEREHRERLKAEAALAISFPIERFYDPERERLAAESSPTADVMLDAVVPLLYMSAAQVDLVCRGNNVFIIASVDDPQDFGAVRMNAQRVACQTVRRGGEIQVEANLGRIPKLAGTLVTIVFEIEDVPWKKQVQF